MSDDRFLTVEEAALLLKYSKMTIYRMIQSGQIPALKIGRQWRIDPTEIQGLIKVPQPIVSSDHTRANDEPLGESWNNQAYDRLLKKYQPRFRAFVDMIVQENPDYIILLERKGERFWELMGGLPNDVDIPIIHEDVMADIIGPGLRGKHVAVFEELTQRGKKLQDVCKLLVEAQAKVSAYAFIHLKQKTTIQDTEAPKYAAPLYCLELRDDEFTKATSDISDLLLYSGQHTDTDHLFAYIKIHTDRDFNVQLFLQRLSENSEVFLIPSLAEQRGILTITCDEPRHLQSIDEYLPKGSTNNGVRKIRLYMNQKTGEMQCLPIFFPSINVEEHTIRDLYRKYPNIYKSLGYLLNSENKNIQAPWWLYKAIVFDLSAKLLVDFLHYMKQVGEAMGFMIYSVELNQIELDRMFSSKISSNLQADINEELCIKLDGKIQASESRPNGQTIVLRNGPRAFRATKAIINPIHTIYSSLQEGYLDAYPILVTLVDILQKNQAFKSSEGGTVTLRVLQNILPNINRETISAGLDLLLDIGSVAPQSRMSQKGVFERSYRSTELGGGVRNINPSLAINLGKASDSSSLRFRRDLTLIAFALNKFMEECSLEHVNLLLANKLIANLLLDWTPLPEKRLNLVATEYRHGPMVAMPRQGIGMERSWDLWDLTEYGAFEKVELNSNMGLDKKALRPSDYWYKPMKTCFDDDELPVVSSYIDIYSKIYKEALTEGPLQELGPTKILSALATSRTSKRTYQFAWADVKLWIEDIRLAFDGLSFEMPDKEILIRIRKSLEAAQAIKEKIEAYNKNAQLVESLRGLFGEMDPRFILTSKIIESLEIPQGPNELLDKLNETSRLMDAYSRELRKGIQNMARSKGQSEVVLSELRNTLRSASANITDEIFCKLEDRSRTIGARKHETNDFDIYEHIYKSIVEYIEDNFNEPSRVELETLPFAYVLHQLNVANKFMDEKNLRKGVFLFADLRGYTQFSEMRPPLETVQMIYKIDQIIQRICERYEGQIISKAGDGTFAIMGGGVDNPHRVAVLPNGIKAFKASEEILKQIKRLVKSGESLPMGIGIDVGDYYTLSQGNRAGRAINRAAKLCAKARGGEILLTEDVKKILTENEIEWSDAESLIFNEDNTTRTYKYYRIRV